MTTSVIYKYAVKPGETVTIGGTIVSLGLDADGRACFWVLGDKSLKAFRALKIVATGEDFDADDGYQYVGTWVEAPFVWHLFEKNVTLDRVKDGTAWDVSG